jgi:hypothetical protein
MRSVLELLQRALARHLSIEVVSIADELSRALRGDVDFDAVHMRRLAARGREQIESLPAVHHPAATLYGIVFLGVLAGEVGDPDAPDYELPPYSAAEPAITFLRFAGAAISFDSSDLGPDGRHAPFEFGPPDDRVLSAFMALVSVASVGDPARSNQLIDLLYNK